MAKMSTDAWAEIRRKYVQGVQTDSGIVFPSVRDLGKEYRVTHSTIFDRVKREGWDQERIIYSNKAGIGPYGSAPNACPELPYGRTVSDAVKTEPAPVLVEGWADFDKSCLSLATEGVAICFQLMKNDEKMTPFYLSTIAGALEKFQKIGKAALGEAQFGETKSATIVFNEINIAGGKT